MNRNRGVLLPSSARAATRSAPDVAEPPAMTATAFLPVPAASSRLAPLPPRLVPSSPRPRTPPLPSSPRPPAAAGRRGGGGGQRAGSAAERASSPPPHSAPPSASPPRMPPRSAAQHLPEIQPAHRSPIHRPCKSPTTTTKHKNPNQISRYAHIHTPTPRNRSRRTRTTRTEPRRSSPEARARPHLLVQRPAATRRGRERGEGERGCEPARS